MLRYAVYVWRKITNNKIDSLGRVRGTLVRLSMTFTANGKRQKWNFCRQSSALCAVESKYLYLQWIVRDTFLFCMIYISITKKE